MHRHVYDTASWRSLPRTECVVEQLLGEIAGPCRGLIHRHHVDPTDPYSRTLSVCARHHPKVHGLLRRFDAAERRRCPHRHTSRAARESCERRLNAAA